MGWPKVSVVIEVKVTKWQVAVVGSQNWSNYQIIAKNLNLSKTKFQVSVCAEVGIAQLQRVTRLISIVVQLTKVALLLLSFVVLVDVFCVVVVFVVIGFVAVLFADIDVAVVFTILFLFPET